MKTAFAYRENRIAPVFDTARQIHIVEEESGRILHESREQLSDALPVQKALRMAELGIGTLVCGAISRPLRTWVSAYGIQVVPLIAGELREVIHAWLEGRLDHSQFSLPGSCGYGRHRSGRVRVSYKEAHSMNGTGRGVGLVGRRRQRQGGGRAGRMGGFLAAGPEGYCICPNCGHRESHQRGTPCVQMQCAKCSTSMTRAQTQKGGH